LFNGAQGGAGLQTGTLFATAAWYPGYAALLIAEFGQPAPQHPMVPSKTGTQSASVEQLRSDAEMATV